MTNFIHRNNTNISQKEKHLFNLLHMLCLGKMPQNAGWMSTQPWTLCAPCTCHLLFTAGFPTTVQKAGKVSGIQEKQGHRDTH